MKNFYISLLAIFSAPLIANAQCGLTDFEMFTGEYFITDITPDVLGFSTFNYEGEPTLVTLFSGVTDASQSQPGVTLPIPYRSFDAVYLPDTETGQDAATFALIFLEGCDATFETIGEIDNSTNLGCTEGIEFGSAFGGNYNPFNDMQFTVVFLTNVNNDCGEDAKKVELFFSREVLANDSFSIEQFEYFIARDNILHMQSPLEAITKIEIANSLGQIVLTQPIDHQNNVDISLNSMARGLYIVNVSSSSGTTTFKTIVR